MYNITFEVDILKFPIHLVSPQNHTKLRKLGPWEVDPKLGFQSKWPIMLWNEWWPSKFQMDFWWTQKLFILFLRTLFILGSSSFDKHIKSCVSVILSLVRWLDWSTSQGQTSNLDEWMIEDTHIGSYMHKIMKEITYLD